MAELSNSQFNLINIFSIVARPPALAEQMRAQLEGRFLPQPQFFESPQDLLAAIIREQGLGEVNTAVRTALDKCQIYKDWQNSMPYLKDVPNIKQYRKEACGVNLSAVNQEVLKHGGYLSVEQVLYSGGLFTSDIIEIPDNPLSTTMCPSVARIHAIQDGGQIAILTIKSNKSILGFAYRTTGNQVGKQEYEVLLKGGLRLKQASVRTEGEFQIRSYDVYSL